MPHGKAHLRRRGYERIGFVDAQGPSSDHPVDTEHKETRARNSKADVHQRRAVAEPQVRADRDQADHHVHGSGDATPVVVGKGVRPDELVEVEILGQFVHDLVIAQGFVRILHPTNATHAPSCGRLDRNVRLT